jgi:hypothetical protein
VTYDDAFDEIMDANFERARVVEHVPEAVVIAAIQDLLHSEDDDRRATGIRCFEKYVTSKYEADRRATVDQIEKARRFLAIGDEDDPEVLRARALGAAKVLAHVLAYLAEPPH